MIKFSKLILVIFLVKIGAVFGQIDPCILLLSKFDCANIPNHYTFNSNFNACDGWKPINRPAILRSPLTSSTPKFHAISIDGTRRFVNLRCHLKDGAIVRDGIYQTVDDFIVGRTYVLQIHQAEGSIYHQAKQPPVRCKVTISSANGDRQVYYTDQMEVKPGVKQWTEQQISFKAFSQSLTIQLEGDFGSNDIDLYDNGFCLIENVIIEGPKPEVILPEGVLCTGLEYLFKVDSEQKEGKPCKYFLMKGNTVVRDDLAGLGSSEGQVITFDSAGEYTLVVECPCGGYQERTFVVEDCKNTEQPCQGCYTFTPGADGNYPESRKYLISAWVKESGFDQKSTYSNSKLVVRFQGNNNQEITSYSFVPQGNIIDGWQRVMGVFTVPKGALYMSTQLVSIDQSSHCFFDDVRIHPFNAQMKSYAYDSQTRRLMAELDQNNFATFYQYDKQGNLVRIKKETERGVFTIEESRSKQAIK